MAEIKNSFLRSKMNKDLDDRLIPNGEYRDAQNISVGKSEADDIGALETVLGNTLQTNFGLSGFEVIGYKAIDNTNTIIVFLTNNTDHYIYSYTPNTSPVLLVSGAFLNFSTSYPISGVSVIEELLFWTDNFNQPRKINITTATTFPNTYYREENHISVAKYNPYQPIGLLSKLSKTTSGLASDVLTLSDTTGITKGMSVVDYTNSTLGPEDYVYVLDVTSATTVQIKIPTGHTISGVSNGDTIYFLQTTMTGEDITFDFNGGLDWPGDPDYLESRFVRLSYRFEFDDGEYSLIAPFTQIAFIPKQKGYYLGSGDLGIGATPTPDDENEAYRSTIVEFMENGVQNIELLIPFPDTLNNVQPTQDASYKIKSIDILYKESDALAIKVVDSIEYNELNENGNAWTSTSDTNIYTYNYQSRKPFRTLPTAQTTRVYDKVPVTALAQETSGNRIIYGNFKDKYTSPEFIDYIVGVGPKSLAKDYDNWVEYPNHSVKQNRNYQVGFVLIDKFGRQSDVVLSGVKTVSTTAFDGTIYGGDTIYNPYNSTTTNIKELFGDSLKIDIVQPISVNVNAESGTPGLYANTGTGYNTYNTNTIYQPTINNNTYIFNQGAGQNEIPTVGSFLEGEFTDYVKVSNVASSVESTTSSDNTAGGSTTALVLVTGNANIKAGMIVTGGGLPAGVTITTVTDSQNFVLSSTQNIPINSSLTYSITEYTITTDGQVSSIYLQQSPTNPDVKYKYSINSKGWYSYKIVVKQQEQDYYNAYLPGILRGYPTHGGGGTNPFPTNENSFTGHIVLLNDNINKIPRDLSQVGPDQKQYKSSVQLSLRVTNKLIGGSSLNNVQYFPGILTDTVSTIATNSNDLNMAYADLDARGRDNIYQIVTNPSIARITFSNNYDLLNLPGALDDSNQNANMQPYLAIYETEPVESLLDIFWETPTVGLISTLNDAINSEYDGAVGWSTYNSNNFTEASTGDFLTGLSPTDQSGANLTNTSAVINQVVDGNGNDVTGQFSITRTGAGPYLYNFGKIGTNFVYNHDVNPRNYTIKTVITNLTPNPDVVSAIVDIDISLQNVQPVINGGVALPAINNVNQDFEGTLATITGENGAADASLKLEQLKWSVTAGNSAGYFSINETTGVLSKSGTGAVAGTYTLTIQLEDTFNNTNTASGSLSITATQQITITSSIIGTAFQASGVTVFNGTCNVNVQVSPDCGTVTYYNQTSSSPTVGDEIRTGPNGASSSLALSGYYSYNCGNTGVNNRNYFQITGSDGVIDVVDTC